MATTHFQSKLLVLPLLLIVACVVAGAYGAVHNQVSYSVSPEYFTKFTFYQLAIGPVTTPRIGAAIVGWKAAWWMGLIIGAVLIPFGFTVCQPTRLFWCVLAAFRSVATTALAVGLVALAASFFTINEGNVKAHFPYGRTVEDNVAFARAGMMHNFSYAGGGMGIFTGVATIRRCVRRSNQPDEEA